MVTKTPLRQQVSAASWWIARVPSFVISGVARIPRKPNGRSTPQGCQHRPGPPRAGASTPTPASGRPVSPECGVPTWGARSCPGRRCCTEGIGSLDLVRILPDTRRYLGRQVSILDLISADTAANLVDDASMIDGWMDGTTAAEIERDFTALCRCGPPVRCRAHGDPQPVETKDRSWLRARPEFWDPVSRRRFWS